MEVSGTLAVTPGPPASVLAQQKIGEAIMIWNIGMYVFFLSPVITTEAGPGFAYFVGSG